jgi:hypothetical protein
VGDGLCDVGLHPEAIAKHDAETVVGLLIALGAPAVEPERGLGIVLGDTLAAEVHATEVAGGEAGDHGEVVVDLEFDVLGQVGDVVSRPDGATDAHEPLERPGKVAAAEVSMDSGRTVAGVVDATEAEHEAGVAAVGVELVVLEHVIPLLFGRRVVDDAALATVVRVPKGARDGGAGTVDAAFEIGEARLDWRKVSAARGTGEEVLHGCTAAIRKTRQRIVRRAPLSAACL